MSETLLVGLIGALAVVLAALIPFVYMVRRDQRHQTEETNRRVARELKLTRERRSQAASKYLELIAGVTSALDALRLDADNADQLLLGASSAFVELQKYGQSEDPLGLW